MQTTKGSRAGRAIRKALLFVLIFAVIDFAAWNVMIPYASLAKVAWSDFRAAKDPGTVFVGSSYAQQGFDPLAFDDALAAGGDQSLRLSYNLGTAGQTLDLTAQSVSDVIASGAKRVVLAVGAHDFHSSVDVGGEVNYLLARDESKPLELMRSLAGFAFRPSVIGTKDSLNVFIPWTIAHVINPSTILKNLNSRMTNENRGYAAEKIIENWKYVGRGYGNYTTTLQPNDMGTTDAVFGKMTPDESMFRAFEQICTKCHEAGVELVVVSTPHPAYDIASMGEYYPAIMNRVQKIAEEQGATFYDFNNIKPEALTLQREDFWDFEHLGISGAKKFSTVFGEILAHHDAGEDVSTYFVGANS